MAATPYGPYDPYVGEVRNEDIERTMSVGRMAMDLANPINWIKYRYMYDPSVYGGGVMPWSLGGGLWSPFGSQLKGEGAFAKLFTGGDTLYDTFKAGRKTFGTGPVGTYKAIKETLSNRIGSSTRIGADLSPVARRFAKSSKIFKTGIEKEMRRTFSGLGGLKSARVSRVLGKRLEELAIQSGGKVSQKALSQTLSEIGKSTLVEDLGLSASKFGKLTESSKLLTGRGVRGLAKTAGIDSSAKLAGWAGVKSVAMKSLMAVGKAYAYYGLATTTWELTKMVAEPLGRALVENANRVALEFGHRYAPEMGGQIAMSYMTSGAATERMRAVDAISKSYINGRSAFGNEAQAYHS